MLFIRYAHKENRKFKKKITSDSLIYQSWVFSPVTQPSTILSDHLISEPVQ